MTSAINSRTDQLDSAAAMQNLSTDDHEEVGSMHREPCDTESHMREQTPGMVAQAGVASMGVPSPLPRPRPPSNPRSSPATSGKPPPKMTGHLGHASTHAKASTVRPRSRPWAALDHSHAAHLAQHLISAMQWMNETMRRSTPPRSTVHSLWPDGGWKSPAKHRSELLEVVGATVAAAITAHKESGRRGARYLSEKGFNRVREFDGWNWDEWNFQGRVQKRMSTGVPLDDEDGTGGKQGCNG